MYKKNDTYAQKARNENYRARSVYKLQEIDEKHKLIRNGITILDLGCAPGSWSQYCLKTLQNGLVIGIDIQDFASLSSTSTKKFIFIKSDIADDNIFSRLQNYSFDLILSDMAPNTTGNIFTDQMRSLQICKMGYSLFPRLLKREGNAVMKIFASEKAQQFFLDWKKDFQSAKILRPKAVQKSSKEMYFIGLGFHSNLA